MAFNTKRKQKEIILDNNKEIKIATFKLQVSDMSSSKKNWYNVTDSGFFSHPEGSLILWAPGSSFIPTLLFWLLYKHERLISYGLCIFLQISQATNENLCKSVSSLSFYNAWPVLSESYQPWLLKLSPSDGFF